MAQQPPLLRDVINIKESISTSDFVLSLAEATTPEGAGHALRDYVVTERLLENFDEALRLIKSALDGDTSKASYLHGSFGSGKSHFMAVLYALLSGNPAARVRSEFDPVLTKHEWLGTDGKKFLLVPYHMLGAKALEQRVLGGYVNHVKKLHPEAPTPQVYRTDSLFADIRAMRANMGDAAVIRGLGTTDGGGDAEEDEWGEGFAWSPQLLDTALAAEENHDPETRLDLVHPSTPAELRAKLVNDASANLLPGFARNAAEDEHGFVSLDAGLSVIAEHAKSLGYHGLILFMDELILWLATLIHDQKFVAREASKITNFVEGGDARRAIPVVSFIARQRDLRELVGEEVSGAAESSIQDTLNLASGRFDKITLEDRNLPQIAHARLLNAKNAEATKLIDAAFEQTKRLGTQVWDTLLGSDKATTGADAESFRLTYPFSPAFMDTLVHISSALQRSRTGLKLMGQLLADHRDELRLGQLIPVGDLYPVIAEGGDKPFADSLKVVFEAADKLYKTKLRPYLLTSYDVTEDDVEQYLHWPDSLTDPRLANRCRMFVGDNRLACTLLLSALAPSVPALSELTIRRLGALNHGSVTAPIPGSEVGIIKNKVAEWAARFPEIKETGTDANAGVRLELSGVDVDSVIANAQVNDNPGNRLALAKRLLSAELGVEHGQFSDELTFVWRGTGRTAEIVFGNIADEDELPDHDLMPQEESRWRIAVDLPFDEGEWGPAEDANRMRRLRERQQGERSRTVAWLPAHLSAQRLADFLARLVVAAFAEMDDRVWVRGGTVLDPAPELSGIKDHDALRSQPLPSEDDWESARQRYETIFGQKAPTLRRGRMVNQFARQIIDSARSFQDHAADLVRKLEEHSQFLGLDETDDAGRLALARRALELLKALTSAAGQGATGAKKTVETLASFDLGVVSADRYGTSVKQARTVAEALTAASWSTLDLASAEGPEGAALLDSLRNVARGDQRTGDLRDALARTQREVLALVKRNRAAATPPPAPTPPAPTAGNVSLNTDTSHPPVPETPQQTSPTTGSGTVRRSGGGRTTAARAAAELQAELAELASREPGATIEITWRVVDR